MINNGTVAIDQYNNIQRRKWQSSDLTNIKHNYLSVSTECFYSIFKNLHYAYLLLLVLLLLYYVFLYIIYTLPVAIRLSQRSVKELKI